MISQILKLNNLLLLQYDNNQVYHNLCKDDKVTDRAMVPPENGAM
jgi:hypothetical protein